MAATVVADTGFLVALIRDRDLHHEWAAIAAAEFSTPWHSCEAVLAEAFHLLPDHAMPALAGLLERRAVVISFELGLNVEAVLGLMRKYANLPIDFADACVVRMTELLPNPIVLTTDSHFHVYRRHSRQIVPCVLPR